MSLFRESTLGGLGSSKLDKLSESLKTLQTSGSGASTSLNRIKKSLSDLPTLLNGVDDENIKNFSITINKLAEAMEPLASVTKEVSNGFKYLAPYMSKMVIASNGVEKASRRTTSAFGPLSQAVNTLRLKFLAMAFVGKRIGNTIGNWVSATSSYMETVQFFNLTMGEFAEQAGDYAKEVESIMGINPDQWMRFQGTLMNISRGFGIAEKSAYKMSKSLNEVAYDLSAMYNTDYETAFQKISSGLAGELEPLRRWGYALDQASLKQLALEKGINKSFNAMTQAEKAQLRYIAIMEQSARMDVFGMMAREIMQPASAIRILRAQFEILSRTLGQLFIPILMKVIPYLIAFTKVAIQAVQRLSALFGFEMPKIASSTGAIKDLGGVIEDDINGGLKDTTKRAKEAQKILAGFDRLNVLSEPKDPSGGAGGGVGIGGGPSIDFGDLPEHPGFLADIEAMGNELIPQMQKLWDLLTKVGGAVTVAWVAFKSWKGLQLIGGFLSTLLAPLGLFFGQLFSGNNIIVAISQAFPTLSKAIGMLLSPITLIIGAVVAVGLALKQLWDTDATFRNNVLTTWESIKYTLQNIYDTILAPIFENIKNAFTTIWDKALQPLWNNFVLAVGGITTSLMNFWNTHLGPFVNWVVNTFGPILANVFGVVLNTISWLFVAGSSFIGGLFTAFGSAFKGIMEILGGIITFITGVFSGDWSKAWDGIKQIFSGMWTTLSGIVKGVWDGIVGIFSNGGTIFGGIVSGIASIFTGIVNLIISGLNKVIALPFNLLNGALNKIRDIDILGFKPFSFIKYNLIPVPQIPKLSTPSDNTSRPSASYGTRGNTSVSAYAQGTNYVPETGLALLHKGETVIPASKQGNPYLAPDDSELLQIMYEQNNILLGILAKDTTVELDGKTVSKQQSKIDHRRQKAIGLV